MQTYSQHFLPKLQGYQTELLERLELLVNIDSGTGQREGINEIMAYLAQWLGEIGCSVSLHDSEGFGQNLVARLQGIGGVRVLLVGQLDTVYDVGAATARPFHVVGGLAFGPGVIDMTSGGLMVLYIFIDLLDSDFDQLGEIILVFN